MGGISGGISASVVSEVVYGTNASEIFAARGEGRTAGEQGM